MTRKRRWTTILACCCSASVLGCSNQLAPDHQWDLISIDGQPLPWSSPTGNGGILSGSVKIDNDSIAERSELTNTGGWTVSGPYTVTVEMLIIDYRAFQPGGLGPGEGADTLLLSDGGLVLRVGGITRRYARR
ncbi:MAG: hypothetical protein DMD62_00355 [Gemmatimonadetes bacterium]|nr:MAG: hypothetical protein DMD62_00355 [Gemmatimonadota bacterium]